MGNSIPTLQNLSISNNDSEIIKTLHYQNELRDAVIQSLEDKSMSAVANHNWQQFILDRNYHQQDVKVNQDLNNEFDEESKGNAQNAIEPQMEYWNVLHYALAIQNIKFLDYFSLLVPCMTKDMFTVCDQQISTHSFNSENKLHLQSYLPLELCIRYKLKKSLEWLLSVICATFWNHQEILETFRAVYRYHEKSKESLLGIVETIVQSRTFRKVLRDFGNCEKAAEFLCQVKSILGKYGKDLNTYLYHVLENQNTQFAYYNFSVFFYYAQTKEKIPSIQEDKLRIYMNDAIYIQKHYDRLKDIKNDKSQNSTMTLISDERIKSYNNLLNIQSGYYNSGSHVIHQNFSQFVDNGIVQEDIAPTPLLFIQEAKLKQAVSYIREQFGLDLSTHQFSLFQQIIIDSRLDVFARYQVQRQEIHSILQISGLKVTQNMLVAFDQNQDSNIDQINTMIIASITSNLKKITHEYSLKLLQRSKSENGPILLLPFLLYQVDNFYEQMFLYILENVPCCLDYDTLEFMMKVLIQHHKNYDLFYAFLYAHQVQCLIMSMSFEGQMQLITEILNSTSDVKMINLFKDVMCMQDAYILVCLELFSFNQESQDDQKRFERCLENISEQQLENYVYLRFKQLKGCDQRLLDKIKKESQIFKAISDLKIIPKQDRISFSILV
eukprot:403368661